MLTHKIFTKNIKKSFDECELVVVNSFKTILKEPCEQNDFYDVKSDILSNKCFFTFTLFQSLL